MWTVLTVALALLAVGIWVRAVEPMVMTVKINAGVSPATQPTTESAAGSAANKTSSPEKQMGILVRGTLLLSFVLICVLLVVGSFGAFQEWVRYRAGTAGRRGAMEKTKYVDAWKLAGERLKEKQAGQEGDGDGPPV